MKRKKYQKYFSMVLATSMILNLPVMAYASNAELMVEISDGSEQVEFDSGDSSELTEFDDGAEESTVVDDGIAEFSDEISEEVPEGTEKVTDYNTFLTDLKLLEQYAENYADQNTSQDKNALVINYIRTGVDRYTSGTWEAMAGVENTDFTEYVKEQDAINNTTVSALKNLEELTLPNGNTVDFGHMFGTMDITYYARLQKMTEDVVKARADLGGWAGDTTDMMFCAVNVDISDKVDLNETDVEKLSEEIRKKYLGVDYATLNHVDHSFTATDLYGDLDAYYIMNELNQETNISSLIENYFTISLTDSDRAAYFLKNRLNNVQKKADIRKAILETYKSNTLLEALEASYGVSDLNEHDNLQTACCYAFADYLYELAGSDNGDSPKPDEPGKDTDTPENGYYTIFSNKSSTLAPGITQDITYALTTDKKQIVYYTATVDTKRDDVKIYANYHNCDGSSWAMARVSDQMAAAQKKHSDSSDSENYIENYNAVVGINADFYNMGTGEPGGALVMNGKEYHGAGSENFFGILKNGTPVIGSSSDYAQYKDQLQEAVGGSVYLVKDGKVAVDSSADYYNTRASRTCIGITEEGKVIMVVLDGRQEPFSAGGNAMEIAQIMLEAGCVTAINLDGGGSSTFNAKQEGSDNVSVINRPSDGYERSVSSSLLVVSTAKTTDEFDHALITTDTDYLTAGSSMKLTATGVSSTGNAADLPENTSWEVTDSSIGTVKEGIFTATKTGDVEIRLVTADGNMIGYKTLHVVVPDGLLFTRANMDVIYGETIDLPLTGTYKGNNVTINATDIKFELSNESAGTIEKFNFTGNIASGIRNVKITAMVASDYSISASMSLALYSSDEAKFDFDSAMCGDRKLAWNREVTNSTEISQIEDGVTSYTYYIKDADTPMVANYTFGLDMQRVEVPEKLIPLLKMVAGGDLESVTAWDILLQLAERVSTKTTVTASFTFDQNVNVDYSALKVVNDYFQLKNASLDKETNTLTLTINWVKQTEAIKAETANPIVIVSGISLTPKENVNWNSDNCLTVSNSGELSYDIYLGANALYSMSSQSSFQNNYGIYPYTEPENSAHPNGGHFASTFRSFADSYTLDRTVKEGWVSFNGEIYYYKDNKPLTGIVKLPGYQNEKHEFYYDLGESGIYKGKLTGLFEENGNKYYAINGELQSGWRMISNEEGKDEYYYFDLKSHEAVDSTCKIGGHTYEFKNHVLVRGAWESDEKGLHYFWAGKEKQNEWFTAEGKQYFAYANSCAVATGIAKTLNHERTGEEWYLFSEKGEWLADYNGLYETGNKTYLIKDGVRVAYPGLFELNGDYYYINSSYVLIRERDYYVSKTNGLKAAGTYSFDTNGKMIIKAPEQMKNGIVKEDADHWYYYENDVKTYAGLIQIDGSYYYVNSKFEVIHNRSYFISKTNGLMKNASYEFDADGKMVIHTPEEMKNGIVKESDEIWYYYINDVKTYAGLIQIDDSYYYVRSNFQVVHGRSYFVSKTNGLMNQGMYEFDEDGKMIRSERLNGIIKESDDTWYYYFDGIKTYAGLIQIDGNYYYVNSQFKVIHNQKYFISKTNGIMPNATYEFDADGKMIMK